MDKRKDAQDLSEAELDTLFRASDAEAPLPSGDLIARILADAEAVQAPVATLATASAPAPAPRGAWLRALRDTLGGWTGVSGLAGAVAMGLVVGVFPPEALSTYSEALLGVSLGGYADYVPALDGVSFDG